MEVEEKDAPVASDLSDGEPDGSGRQLETGRLDEEAPRYPISGRRIGAVEVPMMVMNLDRAVNAFGAAHPKTTLLDPNRNGLPFYLNPDSPWRQPILSHCAKTHNVVLKITVPKRTGRRRRKGADGPWEGEADMPDLGSAWGRNVCSYARLDDPRLVRRKLADNPDDYHVEAVGLAEATHRFRGLADFAWNMEGSAFARRFRENILPLDLNLMKQFYLNPGTDLGPNVDIVPPPIMSHLSLPFNYFYSQNPYVREVENDATVNTTLPQLVGHFIGQDDPVPNGPRGELDLSNPQAVEIMAELEEAFAERPIWTRRSLLNRVGELTSWNAVRRYLAYAAYQFKGGPWRDAVIQYGVDPRTDPKYRFYQTLMFQIGRDHRNRPRGGTWHEARAFREGGPRSRNAAQAPERSRDSHVFDGLTYYTDGKVWQVCDITDPLLAGLLEDAAVRPQPHPVSGWYPAGLWNKVKAIMRTKMVGIMFGRVLSDNDFAGALNTGDQTPPKGSGRIPLPNLKLTDEEYFALTGRSNPKKRKRAVYHKKRDRVGETGEGGDDADGIDSNEDTIIVAQADRPLTKDRGGDEWDGGPYDSGDDNMDMDDKMENIENIDAEADEDMGEDVAVSRPLTGRDSEGDGTGSENMGSEAEFFND